MTLGLWVTIVGIGVSAATALVIAYMHRRQMRQIELYKKYEGMPLKPPRHPITIWMMIYGRYALYCLAFAAPLAIIGANTWILRGEMKKTSPLTRPDVLNIDWHVGLIFLAFIWSMFMLLTILMMKIMVRIQTDTRK